MSEQDESDKKARHNLKADAARYRWLRSGRPEGGDHQAYVCHAFTGHAMDAEIDDYLKGNPPAHQESTTQLFEVEDSMGTFVVILTNGTLTPLYNVSVYDILKVVNLFNPNVRAESITMTEYQRLDRILEQKKKLTF